MAVGLWERFGAAIILEKQSHSNRNGIKYTDQFLLPEPRHPHHPLGANEATAHQQRCTEFGLRRRREKQHWVEMCSPVTMDFVTRALDNAPIYISTKLDFSTAFLGCPVGNGSLSGESGDCTRAARKVRSCWRGDVPGSINRGNASLEGSYGRPRFADPDR